MSQIKAIQYKTEIAKVLNSNPDSVFLYWKGRIALYAVLKAMEVKEGDEIILPGFTCVVVPNAILYLGAKPVYIDISLDNYNFDVAKIESAITDKTKVILCQNTFGLSSNIDKVIEIAKRHHLYTIEDCTHGFGGNYKGKPNGTYSDAAFFSTQWNKPFSTGIGGFLFINNPTLMDPIRKLEGFKYKPGITQKSILSFLIFFRKYFINDFTQAGMVSFFRFLSTHNLILGSTQGNELTELKMPEKYFMDISSVQIRAGLKQIKKLPRINSLRIKNALTYSRFLKLHNKVHVDENLFEDHIFLKYPLLVMDKKIFSRKAKKARVILGDWFVSPLHPVEKDLFLWGFNIDHFPNAVYAAERIVNLPTEIQNNNKVINFLEKNLDEVI